MSRARYKNNLNLKIEAVSWDYDGNAYKSYGFIRNNMFVLYRDVKFWGKLPLYLETLPFNALEKFLSYNGFYQANFDLIDEDGVAIYHGLNTKQFVEALKKLNGYKR